MIGIAEQLDYLKQRVEALQREDLDLHLVDDLHTDLDLLEELLRREEKKVE